MALRKPVVINAGSYQQLQAGDTLDAPAIAGGDTVIQTNGNAGSLVIGTPVYISANDTVDKAQANATATASVIGLVSATSIANGATGTIQLNGVLAATTAQWDTAFGTTGGLTKNVVYFLSAATAGLGAATAPSAVGQLVVRIGTAISTTELFINIQPPILL